MHDPQHRKHIEKQSSSSECQRNHQYQEDGEIESELKDHRSISIISKDRSHPKDQIERQQP